MPKWSRELKYLLEQKSAVEYRLKELERQIQEECPHVYEGKILSALKHTIDYTVCEICGLKTR
jgi:uncharacterized protein (DUF983 family)